MQLMTILAVAVTLAQADPTFEQRWSPLTPLHKVETPVKQRETMAPQEEPRHERHHERRHKRHARPRDGLSLRHKVYHGKSWRCRR
jgi:Ni/Co efflux regulator RcnB